MIKARMAGRPANMETIEEIDGEFTSVIEDFMHAVDVGALHVAKKSGKHSFSQSDDSAFSVTSRRPTRASARRARSSDSAA
jgi:hypothetical protein